MIAEDMHPGWLFEKFEDWALDGVGGWRGGLIFGVGMFPALWISFAICTVPAYVVLIREEWRKRRARKA